MIGARLGPYEITAKLGEGGMGEVYRATDSKLKREVAIKVLPSAFTADRERLARFEREAQLLAQLHHPNVASIFGLEESNGTKALVMELVSGPTLAERLASGALSLDETLAIALQIAQALEEAHEKGIVHRDLKPQNVKVTADGKVKVLDFGLAKALDPAGGTGSDPARSPTLMNSPTLTAAVAGSTQLGMILGTAAYMAPEQARGGAVDKRADIWAFGVVLYEMLSGGRLFEGESVVDTLSAVIRQEIDPGKLPAGMPRRLRELLRRCLERNPKNRLHDIADARIVLEELARGGADEAEGAAASAVARGPAPRPGRAGLALLGVAAAALLAGLALDRLLRPMPPRPAAADARWALALPDALALSTDQFPQLAISEDGEKQVVVAVDATSTPRLLLRTVDELEPRLLPDSAGASAPFFSPDGEWIGFFRDASLSKMPVHGGPPIELAALSTPNNTRRGATWGRDGFIYFSPNVNTGLSRVSENGGPVAVVTRLDGERDERTHRWPQVLPDGSAVLFTSDSQGSTEYYDDARIEAVRTATGERKVLVEGASQARYATGDRLVFARGGSLYSVGFDPRTLELAGAPELAVQGVATDVGSGAVQFALSVSGAALWAPGGVTNQYQLYWVERDGSETPVGVPPEPYNEAQLAPDGNRVALVGGPGGIADLWVADLSRGGVARLTTGEAVLGPVWSPDGRRIAYGARAQSGSNRSFRIESKVADGSRPAETLLESEHRLTPSSFSPDGRTLVYSVARGDGTGTDIHLLLLDGSSKTELLLGDAWNKQGAVVSPDGRWLAYTSTESGQQNVFVRPFPRGEGRWQISHTGGAEPRWSPDQKELFFRAVTSIFRVEVGGAKEFSAGRPERLFDRVSTAGLASTYSLSPDGHRIFTPRSPEGRGSLRTLNLDLGFARRLASRPRR